MKRSVKVGNIEIGGNAQISIQSMTNTSTTDIDATVKQINSLCSFGADLVRVSVPNLESAKALNNICKLANCPIVADIHFDTKLAIESIKNGAKKIRINPSNTPKKDLKELVHVCKEYCVPIRIGVNQGSVKRDINGKELANIALDTAKTLEDLDFFDIVIAVKSSHVDKTIEAYKQIDMLSDYPLHIGLTEAGTNGYGLIKSTVAISNLLLCGIGNTIRVSLSAPPEEEVIAANRILRAVGLKKNFCEVISCPTCARTQINVLDIANKLEKATMNINFPLKIAVMGCIVNGIGESKDADFGVCGGDKQSAIFDNGRIIKTIKNEDIIDELLRLAKEHTNGR